MTELRLLAVVPARGGSKGLPRKNARTLGPRPLLGWTAEAVRASGIKPAALILSTDDVELAEIGSSVGLEVPFLRPAELANDTASALSVVEHAIEWYLKERKLSFDAVAWLQPTSPFRPPAAITEGMRLLERADVDAVVGVKAIHRSLATLYYADAEQRLTPVDADLAQATRRQDVRTLYTPNGALYLSKVDALRKHKSLYPQGAIGVPMDQIASIDIDDSTDWSLAEAIVANKLTWMRS